MRPVAKVVVLLAAAALGLGPAAAAQGDGTAPWASFGFDPTHSSLNADDVADTKWFRARNVNLDPMPHQLKQISIG